MIRNDKDKYMVDLEQALRNLLNNATFQDYSFTMPDGYGAGSVYDKNTKEAIAKAEEVLSRKG